MAGRPLGLYSNAPTILLLVETGPKPDITRTDPNAGELTVHQQTGKAGADAEPRAAAATESQQVSEGGAGARREVRACQRRHGVRAWICTWVKDHCGMELGRGTKLG